MPKGAHFPYFRARGRERKSKPLSFRVLTSPRHEGTGRQQKTIFVAHESLDGGHYRVNEVISRTTTYDRMIGRSVPLMSAWKPACPKRTRPIISSFLYEAFPRKSSIVACGSAFHPRQVLDSSVTQRASNCERNLSYNIIIYNNIPGKRNHMPRVHYRNHHDIADILRH